MTTREKGDGGHGRVERSTRRKSSPRRCCGPSRVEVATCIARVALLLTIHPIVAQQTTDPQAVTPHTFEGTATPPPTPTRTPTPRPTGGGNANTVALDGEAGQRVRVSLEGPAQPDRALAAAAKRTWGDRPVLWWISGNYEPYEFVTGGAFMYDVKKSSFRTCTSIV